MADPEESAIKAMWVLGSAEDAVELCSAGGANSLGHLGAFFIDDNVATGGLLGLALDAVKFAFVLVRH